MILASSPEGTGVTAARAHPRVAVRLPVRVADDVGGFEETFTKDLSVAGAFILAPRQRPIGHQFDAFLCLPNGSSEIATHSEVRWQCGEGWGIRFVMVEPRQREELDRFVGSLLEPQETGDRKHPPVKVQMVVNLQLEGAILRALADNIGHGAVYVRLKRDLHVGDVLEMVLVHPFLATAINLNGQVVRADSIQDAILNRRICGVGVQFKDLDQAHALALEALLRRLLAENERVALRS